MKYLVILVCALPVFGQDPSSEAVKLLEEKKMQLALEKEIAVLQKELLVASQPFEVAKGDGTISTPDKGLLLGELRAYEKLREEAGSMVTQIRAAGKMYVFGSPKAYHEILIVRQAIESQINTLDSDVEGFKKKVEQVSAELKGAIASYSSTHIKLENSGYSALVAEGPPDGEAGSGFAKSGLLASAGSVFSSLNIIAELSSYFFPQRSIKDRLVQPDDLFFRRCIEEVLLAQSGSVVSGADFKIDPSSYALNAKIMQVISKISTIEIPDEGAAIAVEVEKLKEQRDLVADGVGMLTELRKIKVEAYNRAIAKDSIYSDEQKKDVLNDLVNCEDAIDDARESLVVVTALHSGRSNLLTRIAGIENKIRERKVGLLKLAKKVERQIEFGKDGVTASDNVGLAFAQYIYQNKDKIRILEPKVTVLGASEFKRKTNVFTPERISLGLGLVASVAAADLSGQYKKVITRVVVTDPKEIKPFSRQTVRKKTKEN